MDVLSLMVATVTGSNEAPLCCGLSTVVTVQTLDWTECGGTSWSCDAAHSLLDLLLPLLLRQPTLGLLVQVTGQLLLMGTPLLFRRHLILSGTNEHK